MKYGLAFVNTMQWTKGPGAIELARAADDAGFESLWTVEHVVYPDDYSSPYPYSPDGKMPAQASTPIPDPLIWLAFVAYPLWQAGTLWGTPSGETASSFLALPLLVAVVPWGYAWRTYFASPRRTVEVRVTSS